MFCHDLIRTKVYWEMISKNLQCKNIGKSIRFWLTDFWLKKLRFAIRENPITIQESSWSRHKFNNWLRSSYSVVEIRNPQIQPKIFFHQTNSFMFSCWLLIKETTQLTDFEKWMFPFLRYFAINFFSFYFSLFAICMEEFVC